MVSLVLYGHFYIDLDKAAAVSVLFRPFGVRLCLHEGEIFVVCIQQEKERDNKEEKEIRKLQQEKERIKLEKEKDEIRKLQQEKERKLLYQKQRRSSFEALTVFACLNYLSEVRCDGAMLLCSLFRQRMDFHSWTSWIYVEELP